MAGTKGIISPRHGINSSTIEEFDVLNQTSPKLGPTTQFKDTKPISIDRKSVV